MDYYPPKGVGSLYIAALEILVGAALIALAFFHITPAYTAWIGTGIIAYPVIKSILFGLISEATRRGFTLANLDLMLAAQQQAEAKAIAEEEMGRPNSPWRGTRTLNPAVFSDRAGGA